MIKKEKFKKALSLFLALVLMLGIVMPTVSEIAEAKTYYVKHELMGETEVFGSTSWGNGCKVLIGKTNPQIGFCIQPGVSLANGNHSTITPSSIGLSQKKLDKLALIAYYGYRDKTHNNTNYCLTQSLIWKELGSSKRIGIGKYRSESAMKPWFDAVMKKVNRFNVKPSFNGKTYTVNAGETKSIKDTKGVLSELKIKSVIGGKASISGDTLKVTPSGSSNKITITFKRDILASQTKTNFVLRSGKAQAVSPCLSGGDPYQAIVKFNVNLNGKAQITKKSESGKYIKGAKFNIKNASGSVNKNATTDENGKILFSDLKPGKYTVKEVSVPSPYLLDKTPKTVTVKANETAKVSFTNKLPRGSFTLTKTKENGKPLVGAKFKIWSVGNDPEGKKIGYSKTFTTDEKGKISLSGLKLGTYKYQEVAAPNGYVLDSTVRSFKLTYKNSSTAVVTSTGSVKNMMPRGNFKLIKNGVDGSKLAGAEYRVWSVGSDLEGTTINFDKVFTTDKNGELNVTGLKLGKYKYQEVKAPTGYVLDETVGEFTLSYKDQNTAVVGTSAKRVDKKIEVKKLDVNGKLVAGAELKVVDKDNKVVDSWTSTGTVHKIKNLVEGQKYTLVEVKAPVGYVLANPVPFTVTTDKEDQTVEMTDQQVSLIKTDVDGNVVTGATFEIKDKENGKVVDTVSPTEKPAYISNLKEGKTYIVKEVATPEGYVTAKDIEFTVSDKIKEIKAVTVKNKQVNVFKENGKGELIEGAELKVIDKNNKVVDSWTTTNKAHNIKNLVEGQTYTLIEDYAPESFVLAKPIKFKVTEKKENQTINMTDKQVEFVKTDVDGNVISGMEYTVTNSKSKQIVDKGVTSSKSRNFLNGLKIGETYTITETKTPKDFVTSKPIEFTVTEDNKLQTVTMKDKQVTVKKTDIGGENVVGAELKVVDKETGDVIDSWTVKEDEPEHIVQGLIEGKEYTLIEDYAPDGFTISNNIDFTVTEDKVNQTVTMIDKVVDVDKINIEGESLKGVKLQVVNKKTKQIVDEWITDGKPHKISLVEGMEYTLIELESIDGYAIAKPMDFTVTNDKETQHIVMTDKKVQFKKIGLNNKTLIGGKFEIRNKETGKIVDTISAEKDYIDIDNLVEGQTYIIHEVEAPYGYEIAKDIEFTVTYDKKTQKLVMKDIPKEGRIIVTDDNDFDHWEFVKTGDNFGLAMLVILLIASVVGTLFLGTDRKKKHK